MTSHVDKQAVSSTHATTSTNETQKCDIPPKLHNTQTATGGSPSVYREVYATGSAPAPGLLFVASLKTVMMPSVLSGLRNGKRRVAQSRHAIRKDRRRKGCHNITVNPTKQFVISRIRSWGTVVLVGYSAGPLRGTSLTVRV